MVKRNFKISKTKIRTERKVKVGVKATERTEKGEDTIINTRKNCSIIPLYILDNPLHRILSKNIG